MMEDQETRDGRKLFARRSWSFGRLGTSVPTCDGGTAASREDDPGMADRLSIRES